MLKTIIVILLLMQWISINAQPLLLYNKPLAKIIDSFYIFDFYIRGLHDNDVSGELGTDSVIVKVNNGDPIILKANISKILSKMDFASRALIDGVKVKVYKGDTTVVNIKATSCHNYILTKRRCFDIDTTFYYIGGKETFNYFMPDYTFNDKRFGPVVPKKFFYTTKNRLVNKKLLKPKIKRRLMPILFAACSKEYIGISE